MPGGRPSPIDAVVGQREIDGRFVDITVADRIVEGLQVGNYFEHACAAGGVTKETGYEWLRVAGRALIRARGRDLADVDFEPHEVRCIEFSDSVAVAESQWVARANATLEQLARGGLITTHTTIKRGPSPGVDEQGNPIPGPELERTVRTETHLPNAAVLMWRLEKRFPTMYGNRLELVTPGHALTSEERARELVTGIEAFLGDVDAAATVRTTAKRKAKANG